MKAVLVLFAVLIGALVAQAQPDSETVKKALESVPTCSNSVRFDDENLYLGFGAYKRGFEEPRQPIPATLQVVPLLSPETGFTLATSDAALDSTRDGDSLFILTYSGIEEWSLSQKNQKAIYQTYMYPRVMAYKEHAQGFARYNDKVIVAHGRLGVSIFNLKTRHLANQFRLVQRQSPLESMATGVSVVGKYAYIVMDNFSLVPNGQKPAFRGVIVVDMDQEAVVSEIEGLDPGADAVISDGKDLFVSYAGYPIWKYNLAEVRGPKLPSPQMIWKFPVEGHPVGAASLDGRYYYTCFSKHNPGGGRTSLIPMALDRGVLHP